MPFNPNNYNLYDNLTPSVLSSLGSNLNKLFVSSTEIILKIVGVFILFIIGWLIAWIIKIIVEIVLRNIKLKEWADYLGVGNFIKDFSWEERLDRILAEISFWVVFFVFLSQILSILNLHIVSNFINQLLVYLPRAVSGGLILVAGFIFGELTRKVLFGVLHGIEKRNAKTVSSFIKWVIVVFAFITALAQWGIASDLINIFIMGIVLFLALAGGLAFGLGGQDLAKEILGSFKKQVENHSN